MKRKVKVLSLSWGVQSYTLACMVAQKELPMVDVAITADPGFERNQTYKLQLEYLNKLQTAGLKIEIVENKLAKHKFLKSNQVFIPAFTSKSGQLLRTCTQRWKIAPIRRKIRELFGKCEVEMWLGISTDEITRMKPSRVKYITNRYPLIELGLSRSDCVRWLMKNNYPIPVKSSCVFCPYHSRSHWHDIRKDEKDWQRAIDIDELIRNKLANTKCFTHPDRTPLSDMPEQESLFGDYMSECEGYCFA